MNVDKINAPKVLVFGANGMLGQSLLRQLSNLNVVAVSRRPLSHFKNWVPLKSLKPSEIHALVESQSPQIIINCVALTNIDLCEKNKILADQVHVELPKTLAEISYKNRVHNIYISTDQVFAGDVRQPYRETDQVGPLNYYAKTKYWGEEASLYSPDSLVLRTNILGHRQKGEPASFAQWVYNSLCKNLEIKMFTDFYFNPISTVHLAKLIEKMILIRTVGRFHACGGESLNKYEFGLRMAEYFGFNNHKIVPATVLSVGLTAPRPQYCVLDSQKLFSLLGESMPNLNSLFNDWKQELNGIG